MRTREEQVSSEFRFKDTGLSLMYRADFEKHLLEAERRAEQRVRAEIARDSVKHYPVHYAPVKGQNLSEMQKNVRSHPLYSMGDVRLVWVNEGDLYMPGSAVLVARCNPSIDAAREQNND